MRKTHFYNDILENKGKDNVKKREAFLGINEEDEIY
jgi:hypothetical protein